MSFKHKNTSYMPLYLFNKFKVHVVWLIFLLNLGLNILILEISPRLLRDKTEEIRSEWAYNNLTNRWQNI